MSAHMVIFNDHKTQRYLQASVRYSLNKRNSRVELQQSMTKLAVKNCGDFDSI